jgi:diguanylate cyclase (GGDEF)-like protein
MDEDAVVPQEHLSPTRVDAEASRVRTAVEVAELERSLLHYLDELTAARDLETALGVATAWTTRCLGTERASLRVLDATRARLLVAARSGVPLHPTTTQFTAGEGLVGWVVAQNRPLRVGWAAVDPRFSPRPGVSASLGSFLGAPLADADGCFGVLATTRPERDAFSPSDARRLELLAKIASPLLAVHRLRRLAETDPLTSVSNRHALEHALPEVSAKRVAVAMIDVDHFKRINDTHGHAKGDEVLREVARELRATVRTDDHVLRMGGEEFLVVLPLASAAVASALAEEIRTNVSARVRAGEDSVSLSIGVAVRLPGETRQELLRRADEALYEAKRLGRDRVVAAASM